MEAERHAVFDGLEASEPMVSVVVPVYNVARYLCECLDSVLGQNLRDIEVICADDGSTDGSGEILARYAANDPRVRVVMGDHRGLGATRNRALAVARGRYLAFVDSDDYVEPDIWTTTVSCAETEGADLILFDVERFEDGTGKILREPFVYHPNPFRGCCYPHNRLVARELWADMRFPENVFGEDMLPHIRLSLEARRIVHLERKLYHYRQRASSLMGSARESRATDHLVNAASVLDYLDRSGRFGMNARRWAYFAYEMINLTYKYSRKPSTVEAIRAWTRPLSGRLCDNGGFALRLLLLVLKTGSNSLFVVNWWVFHALRGVKKVVRP